MPELANAYDSHANSKSALCRKSFLPVQAVWRRKSKVLQSVRSGMSGCRVITHGLGTRSRQGSGRGIAGGISEETKESADGDYSRTAAAAPASTHLGIIPGEVGSVHDLRLDVLAHRSKACFL